MAKVAIVIVCMNNLKNLIPCLDSIKKYTKIDYEVWVTAYLFSAENLKLVKQKYPEVHWVISNEIRGFAENNNLVLRQVNTEYTLILNDDTEFKEPVLDELLDSIEKTTDAAIMSPKLVYRDGRSQFCGRDPWTALTFIKSDISLFHHDYSKVTKYTNHTGIFQSYNVTGACFLIKQDVFKELGFFDERYFFCPEDIALSTLANNKGFKCYVDSDITLYHFAGETRSKVKVATLPSQRKGSIIYFADGNKAKRFLLESYVALFSFLKFVMYKIRNNPFEAKAQWNCVKSAFSSKSTKEIFMQYYAELKREK